MEVAISYSPVASIVRCNLATCHDFSQIYESRIACRADDACPIFPPAKAFR